MANQLCQLIDLLGVTLTDDRIGVHVRGELDIYMLVLTDKVEWQDPNDPTCGNGDGLLYFTAKVQARDWSGEQYEETLLCAYSQEENFIYIS
jgi:hypothetical protein